MFNTPYHISNSSKPYLAVALYLSGLLLLFQQNYYLDFINYKMIKIPTSLLLKNGPSSVSPTLHNPSYRATGP